MIAPYRAGCAGHLEVVALISICTKQSFEALRGIKGSASAAAAISQAEQRSSFLSAFNTTRRPPREGGPKYSARCSLPCLDHLDELADTTLQTVISVYVHAGSVLQAIQRAEDRGSEAQIPEDQLHSLLVQVLSGQASPENAELQAAVSNLAQQRGLTFLPFLNPSPPIVSTPPHRMAGNQPPASSLAGVLEDLGYGCTQNSAAFQDVLGQVNTIDETNIASMLGMMMRTHTGHNHLHGAQVMVDHSDAQQSPL